MAYLIALPLISISMSHENRITALLWRCRSKLAAMPDTFWEDVVGADIAPDITTKQGSELRQVLDTLPLDLKLIIKNQVP